MDNELQSLCKQLYEKTGWKDVRDFYHENDTFDEETQTFKRNGIFSIVERQRADYNTPLYTSDYLLEKLPPGITKHSILGHMFMDNIGGWTFGYEAIGGGWILSCTDRDTPLKALLKLTLALCDAGIIGEGVKS